MISKSNVVISSRIRRRARLENGPGSRWRNDQNKIEETCSNQVEDKKNIGDVCHKAAVDKNRLQRRACSPWAEGGVVRREGDGM